MLDWPEPDASAEPEFKPGNLEAKFVAPPFSVLDTRQGYWQSRRRAWLSLGIKSEIGRGLDLLKTGANSVYNGSSEWSGIRGATVGDARAFSQDLMKGEGTQGAGTSIFDPVLCELMYRWFAPPGGHILDPFAGGSVRGIVAAKLGHPYAGIDLSARQLEANRAQAELLISTEPMPAWHHGDSRDMARLLPDGQMYDMVFSCPPYFDLEVYSDDPQDLSAMSWHDFLVSYEAIIEVACQRLLPGRFACFVVSEIRGPDGAFRGLVPRTIHAFERAGMRFYNEAILVNSAGSLPLRVTKYMESSRKLGRAHQNVLVFVKGDPERGWSYDREAPASPQMGMF